jgi:hypothetical protein
MTSRLMVRSALFLFAMTVFAASLSAQKGEIYPNAGYFWSDTMNNGQRLQSDGIYGLKGGVFLNQNVQLEGSFGYLNHFELRPSSLNPSMGAVRGFLYDVNLAYNFGERQFLNHRISPFITAGTGGLTTHIPNAPSMLINGGTTLENKDTFLTVNYGAGVKFLNVAGPMGFRFDVRGRTLPNFFGETTTWFEPTAGLTFSWGER